MRTFEFQCGSSNFSVDFPIVDPEIAHGSVVSKVYPFLRFRCEDSDSIVDLGAPVWLLYFPGLWTKGRNDRKPEDKRSKGIKV